MLNVPVKVIERADRCSESGWPGDELAQPAAGCGIPAPPLLACTRRCKLAACRIADGIRDAAAIKREALAELNDSNAFASRYFELADPVWMEPVRARSDGSGPNCCWRHISASVRLIDNVLAEPVNSR